MRKRTTTRLPIYILISNNAENILLPNVLLYKKEVFLEYFLFDIFNFMAV